MSKQSFTPVHRRAIWEAHKHKCFYCSTPLKWDDIRIDHVVPEHLNDKPEERKKVLLSIGLNEGWSLNEDHNLVPSCNPCNSQKGGQVYPEQQLIHLLNGIKNKPSQISNLKEKFTKQRKEGQLKAQLEFALASGLITESDIGKSLAAASASDDLVSLTSSLEFLGGVPLDQLKPSAVDELMDKPVHLGGNVLPEGLELQHDNGTTVNIFSCRDYEKALDDGYFPYTTVDIKMTSFFTTALGILKALAACRPSSESFIRHERIGLCDIDLLPTSLLSNSTDDDDILKDYESVGDLVCDGKANIYRVSSNMVSIEFNGMNTYMREILRADLDGDGIEDMLVSYYVSATHGTFGAGLSPIALARRSNEELFSETKITPTNNAEL